MTGPARGGRQPDLLSCCSFSTSRRMSCLGGIQRRGARSRPWPLPGPVATCAIVELEILYSARGPAAGRHDPLGNPAALWSVPFTQNSLPSGSSSTMAPSSRPRAEWPRGRPASRPPIVGRHRPGRGRSAAGSSTLSGQATGGPPHTTFVPRAVTGSRSPASANSDPTGATGSGSAPTVAASFVNNRRSASPRTTKRRSQPRTRARRAAQPVWRSVDARARPLSTPTPYRSPPSRPPGAAAPPAPIAHASPRDHRDHPVRRHAATRDAAHDVIYAQLRCAYLLGVWPSAHAAVDLSYLGFVTPLLRMRAPSGPATSAPRPTVRPPLRPQAAASRR